MDDVIGFVGARGGQGTVAARIDQPGIGKVRAGGSPLSFSAFVRQPPGPAPRLGQHTEEILSDDLGLGAAEIGRLFDQGLVAGPGAA